MRAMRRVVLLGASAALAVAFCAPASAYHICVEVDEHHDVCVCTRPTDHNCGHRVVYR